MYEQGLQYASNTGLPDSEFSIALQGVLNFSTMLLAALGVLGFLISGIIYIGSTGNEERMQMAKKAMIYSTIGIAVGALGYVIVNTIVPIFKNSGGF